MADEGYPKLCAYCGAMNVYLCTDRVDVGESQGQSIRVERCTVCGKDA